MPFKANLKALTSISFITVSGTQYIEFTLTNCAYKNIIHLNKTFLKTLGFKD